MPAKQRASSPARNGARRASQAYDGTVRAQLGELQRARIVGAMLDVSYERGASGVSVAHVVKRSGVSRRTFYELFTGREECFLAAFEQALSYAAERVVPAYEVEKPWRDRVRAALVAFLTFLDEEPIVGRVLITESLACGAEALARRQRVIADITNIVEEGAAQGKSVSVPPPLTGEGVVGGVLAVIQSRLAEQSQAPLVQLTNPLMSMIVLPYMGAGAARRELERTAPKPSADAAEPTLLGNPFKEVGMRLTYRTVRVLMALAEHPGGSNRLIGDMAEIKDQGQVSKLLGRLQRAGMVANTGAGPRQGAPNVWTLTPSGRQLTESIRASTEGSIRRGRRR